MRTKITRNALKLIYFSFVLLSFILFAAPFFFQKYILGYLARIVFYKTEQVKAEQEQTPHIKPQKDQKDSRAPRGSEESEKAARTTVNKWRKRKVIERFFKI